MTGHNCQLMPLLRGGGHKGYFMTWHKLFFCPALRTNLEKIGLFMSHFYFYFSKLKFNQ